MTGAGTQAAIPRPSATVVLLRESERGPELLLVKRRAGDAFGDSYTFPGGVLDTDEASARPYCQGISPQEMDSILGVSEGGLDYCSAAIRELFEEIGILLARGEDGQHLTDNREIQVLRTEIYDGSLTWPDFLQQHELSLACDSLHYFAHWITPSQQPKRWSTRFFLARLPAGQTSRPDGHELTDSRWLTVAEALSSGRDGSMKIPFPTFKTLETLAEHSSIEAMLDWARSKAREGIHETRPVVLIEDGGPRIIIPEGPEVK